MTRLVVSCTLVAMFAAAAPIVVDAQRGGGGHGGGRGGGGRDGAVPSPSPSLNRPSFPLDGLNRPSFPLDGLNRPSFPVNGQRGIGSATFSPFDARPGSYTPRSRGSRSRGPRSFGIPLGYGFGVPGYVPAYADTDTYDREAAREPEIMTGVLFLDVTPSTALVFVDTAYVGSVQDLQARGVTLKPGRHWLDLEALDFEKKTVEVTITAGEPLRYRVDLAPVRRAAATVIPPRPPETMYAIPGCYGGNRPPVAASLPKGCDIANVRVIRPQPRIN